MQNTQETVQFLINYINLYIFKKMINLTPRKVPHWSENPAQKRTEEPQSRLLSRCQTCRCSSLTHISHLFLSTDIVCCFSTLVFQKLPDGAVTMNQFLSQSPRMPSSQVYAATWAGSTSFHAGCKAELGLRLRGLLQQGLLWTSRFMSKHIMRGPLRY